MVSYQCFRDIILLVGYNHNIMHNGTVYHIQTEDSGSPGMHVTTLLYCGGTILASKRTDYKHLAGTENPERSLRELMQNQHKELLIKLKDGEYGAGVEEKESARKEQKGEALSILDVLKSMENSSFSDIFNKPKKTAGIVDKAPEKDASGFDSALLNYLSKEMNKKEEKK